MDYEKIGLKAGLEIHQQLDTGKLFSRTPSFLRKDEPHYKISRRLHKVAGETGAVDSAVSYEANLKKEFIYEGYHDTTSLVELDESPPQEIDREALDEVLKIAELMNCEIYQTSQIMRKTIIDGSNTSGFQRTVLIAHDGFIDTSFGTVIIDSIALEEDSARIISKDEKKSIYRLDRLGIPLVEITTAPTMKTPEQIKEAALKIGEILRACKVKRGIGTIRQDLNISIKGHDKVEIKGFQEPKIMIQTVDLEIERQLENIKKSKNSKPEIQKSTKRKSNPKINFNDNEEKNRDDIETASEASSTNFEGEARAISVVGVGASDLAREKYSSASQVASRGVGSGEENLIKGEVRNSLPDGKTEFLRPLPGKDRMYPETDLPILKISRDKINEIKKKLPKLKADIKSELQKKGVSAELIPLVMENLEEFENLSRIYSKNTNLIAKMIVLWRKEIASKNNSTEEKINEILSEEILEIILEKLIKKEIEESETKLFMEKIVDAAKNSSKKEIAKIAEKIKIEKASHDEVEEEISKLIKEKPGLRPNAYMGLVMQKFKGKLDAKKAMELIEKILEK